MKPKSTLRHFLALAASSLLAVSSAHAQSTLYWDGGSADLLTDGNGASAGTAGTWDTTLLNWDAGASPHVAWNNSNNDTAVFAGTAGTVTLGTGITAGGLTFNTSGYSITGSTLTLAGASAPILNVSTGTSTISSNVDGTNGLEKTGGGTLVLSGTSNTYSGTTTISAGTLQGTKNTTGGASPFGTSTIQLNAGTLSSLTVSANDTGETFTFGNNVTVGGNSTIGYGRVGGTGSNKTHVYGNLSIGNSTLSLTAGFIGHTLSFTGANLTGNAVLDGATIYATTNIGAITETGGPRNLTKSGGNTLRLTGDNTYTGTTTISGGTLEVQGSIASSSITNNATLTFNSGSAQSYSNGISGSGALTKSGAGVLTLGGTNTYLGNTTVTGGALSAMTTAALPGYNASGKVIINGGTVGVQIGGSGWSTTDADTLLTNATKTSGAFGIDTTNGNLTQWVAFDTSNLGTTLGLNKLGSNTLTLDQTNSYAGATTVTGGVLNIQIAGALGTTTNGTTVRSGAALEIQGGITTTAEALTLNGSGISNGGALRNISGNNTYAGNITLGSSARINSDAGLLTGSGTVTLGANTLTVGGAGNTILSNNVTGANGNLIKEDAGILTLTNSSNTYTGTTTVNGGILEVGGGGRLNSGSYAGAISIADGAALKFTSNQAQTLSGAITGAGTLTKTNAGALTLNNNRTHTANISSATGVTLPTGTTTFNGNLSLTAGNLTANSSGTIVAGTGLLTMSGGTQFRTGQNITVTVDMDMKFQAGTILAGRSSGGVGTYNFNGDLELGGNVIFGSGTTSETLAANFNGNISDGENDYSLTFHQNQSGGSFTLAGDNTFGGGVNMNNARTLNINSPTALGTGTFTIGSTAILDNTSSGGAVVMTANNAQNWNSNFTFTGTNSLNMGTGAVTINANRSVTVSANVLAVGGIGQDTGGRTLTKLGAGTLAIHGASTYTGSTTITTGTLQLGNGGTAGSLTGTSGITNNANLTINRSNAFTQATDLNGKAITGTGSFTQAGSGTTTLSLTNTYTGATTVSEGTLLINGSTSSTSLVTVNNGGTLGGTGTVGGATTVDGALKPGNSTGLLTVGSLDLNTGASTTFEINGINRGAVTNGYDALGVNTGGSIDFDGALIFEFGNLAAFAANTEFDLFSFDTTSNGDFSSVVSTGFYTGTWSKTGDIWSLTDEGQTLNFSEVTGNLVVVPEPRAALLGGLGLLALLRRRRN